MNCTFKVVDNDYKVKFKQLRRINEMQEEHTFNYIRSIRDFKLIIYSMICDWDVLLNTIVIWMCYHLSSNEHLSAELRNSLNL